MTSAPIRSYSLPALPYAYDALVPRLSEEQLRLHHEKHHQAYVDSANSMLMKLESARNAQAEIDTKSALKSLSFSIAGHYLHCLFWNSISPSGGGVPKGRLAEAISRDFGSLERFRLEFSQAALSVEGSGWAALARCPETGRLLIMQIEKHNMNIAPGLELLLVIDVWEHAYYIDYRNARAKFIEAFWGMADWDNAGKKFESLHQ